MRFVHLHTCSHNCINANRFFWFQCFSAGPVSSSQLQYWQWVLSMFTQPLILCFYFIAKLPNYKAWRSVLQYVVVFIICCSYFSWYAVYDIVHSSTELYFTLTTAFWHVWADVHDWWRVHHLNWFQFSLCPCYSVV